MAATDVVGGLMQAPAPAGSASLWKAQALLCGLQTLGLIQVPAAHLGKAGQEE